MYKRILIVVGDRAVDRVAIKEGLALAKIHGSSVLFVHVLPRYVLPLAEMGPLVLPGPPNFEREIRSNGQRLLAAARVAADRAGVRNDGALGSGVDDAECIVEMVRTKKCNLVVVATEGRNALARLFMGSVIPGLITLCPVPVLVCRKPEARAAVRQVAPIRPLRRARAVPPVAKPVRVARRVSANA